MSVRWDWPITPRRLGRLLITAGALSAAAAIAQARVLEATAPPAPEMEAMLQPAVLVAPARAGALRQSRTDSITAIADSGPSEQPMAGFDPLTQPVAAAVPRAALSGRRAHRRDRAAPRDLPRAGSRTAERD